MKFFAKKIILFLQYITTIFKVILYFSITNRLKYSKDKINEKINILGNGPSLKNDIIRFSDNDTILVVNDFALTDIFLKLKPKYYILADPGYWLPEGETHNSNIEMRHNVFARIKDHATWKMNIYVPLVAFKTNYFQLLFKDNPNISIYSVNTIPSIHKCNQKMLFWIYKNNYSAPANNVLSLAIYISINLGYKKINLFGADHSWLEDLKVNQENMVCLQNRHFFDEESELVPWLRADGDIFKMHEILHTLAGVFLSYDKLSEYAQNLNVEIINYTPNSFIDAFVRKKY